MIAVIDAREYLNQVKKIELLIQNKLAEREYWRGVALNTTAEMGGERVQSSSDPQKMASAVCRYVDIEREIDGVIDRLYETKTEVLGCLEQLDADEYDVLYKRYIQFMSVLEVADVCGKSKSWVLLMQKRGIAHTQAILDAQD